MSTSEVRQTPAGETATEFDDWLAAEFESEGSFTALIVLVEIGEISVTPQASTFVNVIGTDVAWGELLVLLEGARCAWDGVAFFTRRDGEGRPLDNLAARLLLSDLERELAEDRLVLNQGQFFDRLGRRMRVDEVTRQ